ncbi:unnamed protein product [Polarella glacialis]|uniref:Uncharacterized protein n=2 Tax=Polarella glacialis TaxID=89957 RepID=A0A813D8L3_POLGL|nr:unnamed protein product [Polarella glacialis]
MPSLVLAIVPGNRGFAHRAVASAAAGSFVVAASLYLAERAIANTERFVAVRQRTFALTDAFSNEAEQQGAILPVASAATIAISGAITFGVEFNPYVASGLCVLQALTWVLASRKAVSAKFESDAAFQVQTVVENSMLVSRSNRGEEVWRRFKRFILNWPL